MAYYIFLKSLRSLEEFRKNPHVKIPPKSPTNFQILGKFKNPILIQKFFSLLSVRPTLRPARPLAQPAHRSRHPSKPKPSRSAHPARASVASSREIRFPFWFAPSRAGRLSVKRALHVSCVSPTVPTDLGPFLPSPPATPRRPSSDLEMPDEVFTPRLGSPP
jgi:hypothetical protein